MAAASNWLMIGRRGVIHRLRGAVHCLTGAVAAACGSTCNTKRLRLRCGAGVQEGSTSVLRVIM
eukprot:1205239-Pyramimonas_sp.AAC.1